MSDFRDTADGRKAIVNVSNGATHTWEVGKKGTAHNREIAALVGTPVALTWTPTENITQVTITAVSEDFAETDTQMSIAVCFDAPDATQAALWLTAGNHLTSDSLMSVIPINTPVTYNFSSYLSNMYAVRLYGSGNIHVLVEAA